MIPLVKSNFSIGKSILTLAHPEKDVYPDGPKSIFSIAKEESLKDLVILDDSFYGFYAAYSYCKENSINLIYGVTMSFSEEGQKDSPLCKVAVFIRNKAGYADLIALNSQAAKNGFLTKTDLETLLTKNLLLAIPFYDSFIHKNALTFAKFSDYILKFSPIFFTEDNGLPFDRIIAKAVKEICGDKFPVIPAKTICYYNRSDIDAFLTYKCICNRSFSKRSLSKPNFEHFSSDEFCWQSFKEKNIEQV